MKSAENCSSTPSRRICKYLGPNMASWYKERLSKLGGASEGFVRNYDGTVTTEDALKAQEEVPEG